MQTTRALGKGLASLIPAAASTQAIGASKPASKPEANAEYFECLLENIVPCADQPRKLFSKESLEELAASIQEQGVIQPLIVRPIQGGKFELIAGERRFRASKLIGLEKIPVVVKDTSPDRVLELALIENIQREDLNPIEEALAYRELQEKHQLTQDEIAQRVGKNRSSVANSLRLLSLPEEIRGDIIEGRLSMGHARTLLAIEDDAEKISIKRKILKQGLSVRELEDLIRNLKTGGRPISRRATRGLNPQLQDLENKMTKALGTKVKIQSKGQKGKVLIEYYSPEDLDRIFDKLTS